MRRIGCRRSPSAARQVGFAIQGSAGFPTRRFCAELPGSLTGLFRCRFSARRPASPACSARPRCACSAPCQARSLAAGQACAVSERRSPAMAKPRHRSRLRSARSAEPRAPCGSAPAPSGFGAEASASRRAVPDHSPLPSRTSGSPATDVRSDKTPASADAEATASQLTSPSTAAVPTVAAAVCATVSQSVYCCLLSASSSFFSGKA